MTVNSPARARAFPARATLTRAVLAVGASLLSACASPPADLSPDRWPPGELERYATLDRAWAEPIPLAVGSTEMIAATATALAVRSGYEALRQGGTAADAVLTHALANVVLLAGCCVSHAGFMNLVYREAATGEVHTMNAGWNTVRREDDPLSIPGAETPSGRGVLVPGFMAGVEAAHRRFGHLPFATIFQPAIHFAEEGFVLGPRLGRFMAERREVITRLPATRAIFTREDGELYQAGDRFRQPALARTLRGVASEGAAHMYTGEWAQKFVETVQAEGGRISMEDLAAYEVRWEEPLHGNFQGYDLYTLAPPNLGGTNLIEALHLAEEADLAGRPHYTRDPEALRDLIAIARVAEVLGTSILPLRQVPDELLASYLPGVDPAPEARATRESARALWEWVRLPEWTELQEAVRHRAAAGADHSDAVVAVDREGNVAALIHTINTTSWGASGITVEGVSIGDPGYWQQALIARTEPGARLPDPTNPLLVLRDGEPVLASSTIGSGLHETALQSILNVLAFGMDPKAAGDTAQFLRPHALLTASRAQAVPEGELPESLLAAVRAAGQPLETVTAGTSAWRGYWVGIRRDPGTGRLEGGTTRFFNGRAVGN